MPSHYKNLPLFASGPHRFATLSQGHTILSDLSLGASDPNTLTVGIHELDVTVTGRLVAPTDAALWTLREALAAQLIFPPEPGLLEDSHGKQWASMTLIRIDWDTRTDRSRTCSIAYVTTFRRFAKF